MILNAGALQMGHCSPVAGLNFASSVAMRALSASTSDGSADTRFQTGMRSSAFMMSSIMPMVGSFSKDHSCESANHSESEPAAHIEREGAAARHIPGDTRTPAAPDAVRIGPSDV